MSENKLLITLHGARSTSQGMHALSEYCKHRLPGLKTYTINYGEIGLRQAIRDSNLRRLVYNTVTLSFRTVAEKLQRSLEFPHGPSTKIFVAAQSFGTLALYEYLRAPYPGMVLDQVILVGSILPQLVDWDYLVEVSGVLRAPPVNFARPFDLVARQAYRITNERTTSGARGFSPVGRQVAVNSFKHGGHSSYNPDDFDDIASIVGGSGWVPNHATEEAFLKTLTITQRIKLGMYRSTRIS